MSEILGPREIALATEIHKIVYGHSTWEVLNALNAVAIWGIEEVPEDRRLLVAEAVALSLIESVKERMGVSE